MESLRHVGTPGEALDRTDTVDEWGGRIAAQLAGGDLPLLHENTSDRGEEPGQFGTVLPPKGVVPHSELVGTGRQVETDEKVDIQRFRQTRGVGAVTAGVTLDEIDDALLTLEMG